MRSRILFRFLCSLLLLLASGAQVAQASALPPDIRLAHQQPSLDEIESIRATEPGLVDDFSTDEGTWQMFYDGDTAGFFRAGQYYINVESDSIIGYGLPTLNADDFLAEVDVTHIGGPLENEAGIIFRYVDESNFYYYAIGNDGFFSLSKLVDGTWEMLIDWEESLDIIDGEGLTNRIGVMAQGSTITLIANDAILGTIEDDTFAEGGISFAAGSLDVGGIDIAFDNFSLWYLGEDVSVPGLGTPRRPSATPTPDPQTTAEFIDEIVASPPTYVDDFQVDDRRWSGTSSADTTYNYEDGAFHIGVVPTDWTSYSAIDLEYVDFYVEIDTTHVSGPSGGEYGLFFRNLDGNNYYFYAITASGYYSLWKRVNNEWETVKDWEQSLELESGLGAFNRIGVLARGDEFALVANGFVLAEIQDDSFAEGNQGVFVGSFEEGNLEVAFDNFSIWDLTSIESADTESVDAENADVPDNTVEQEPAEERTEERTEEPAEEPEEPVVDEPEIEEPETEEPDIEELPFDATDIDSDGAAQIATIAATEPTFSDDFGRDTGSWVIEPGDAATYAFQGRALRVSIHRENWLSWALYDEPVDNVLVETDISHISGPLDAGYGLIARYTDPDNFYIFRISGLGTYSFMRQLDNEWIVDVDWTESDLIDTSEGAVNRLGILADGSTIVLTINGTVVQELTDDSLTRGQVALVAGAYSEVDFEVAFDNVDIWDLGQ